MATAAAAESSAVMIVGNNASFESDLHSHRSLVLVLVAAQSHIAWEVH